MRILNALILGSLLLGASADIVLAGSRQGGEVMQDATPILSLTFEATGTTLERMDDYDVACPDTSAAPDVVYSYTNNGNEISQTLDIQVCSDSYDTKLFVYAEEPSLKSVVVIGCDQDTPCSAARSSWGSRIDGLVISAGRTIYIVVDGDNGESGSYAITVDYQPGACCLSSGECVLKTPEECWDLAGSWRGAGAPCSPNPCITPAMETSWGHIKAVYR